MAFDSLSEKLQNVFKNLRSKGRLTEDDVKAALKEVNYPLLLTFCVFFVFSGNAARIPAVNELFSTLLPKNTLLFGILSCQCISNVPSAVLLSHFTMDYASLLPAVNIGGLGTPIPLRRSPAATAFPASSRWPATRTRWAFLPACARS